DVGETISVEVPCSRLGGRVAHPIGSCLARVNAGRKRPIAIGEVRGDAMKAIVGDCEVSQSVSVEVSGDQAHIPPAAPVRSGLGGPYRHEGPVAVRKIGCNAATGVNTHGDVSEAIPIEI